MARHKSSSMLAFVSALAALLPGYTTASRKLWQGKNLKPHLSDHAISFHFILSASPASSKRMDQKRDT
jgi:hypothetical protein